MLDNSNNLMLDVELANKQVKPNKGPVTLHILNLPSTVNWEVRFFSILYWGGGS